MSRLASRLPAWPFVLVVLAIAVLSLLAPSSWRNRFADSVDAPPSEEPAPEVALAVTDPGTWSGTPTSPWPEQASPANTARVAPQEVTTEQVPAESFEFVSTETPQVSVAARPAERAGEEPSGTARESLPFTEPIQPSVRVAPQPQTPASSLSSSDPVTSVPVPAEAVQSREGWTTTLPDEEPQPSHTAETAAVPTASAPAVSAAWPAPRALIASLQRLVSAGIAPQWSAAVLQQLARWETVSGLDDPQVASILAALRGHLGQVDGQVERLSEQADRSQLMRCAYALSRRLAVWNSLHELSARPRAEASWSLVDTQQVSAATQAVELHLARMQHAAAWRQYLCLDALSRWLPQMTPPQREQRDLARQILARLDPSSLNESQASFLNAPAFQQLATALRGYAQEPVDPAELLLILERYEERFGVQEATTLARGFQVLKWSTDEREVELSQPLNDHYRNANVRVAISESLINRVLPDEHATVEDVDDMIRNARVRGQSQTSSRVRVFLVPDRWQWRLGLEAKGNVAAQTESHKGPATFFQDAWSNYQARKHVTVDKRGVRTERAEARARSSSDLRGFATDYDDIPLLSLLARSIASRKYQEESRAATTEVEQRVAAVASQRLDEEVQKRLSDAEGEFQKKWLSPLRQLGLDPTPIDFETTEERLIVRYRLASQRQLAAHTPRPQAPSNSWLSVQLHESAINNTFDQLGLGGRKIAIEDLYRELAAKFARPAPTIPDDLPEGVTVTLAPQEAIRVRCDNGQVTLTLRIAELAQGRQNRWRNFEVRATYVPMPDQREANLVRDGIIELGGERRGLGNQVALRAIFAKVLSKSRPIRLINHSLARQPQLADLAVNQFIIHDGWIGVAMAPLPNTARIPYRQSRPLR